MRISGSRPKTTGLPAAGETAKAAGPMREAGAAERVAEESDYLPSADLARLTALAAQEPEVRDLAIHDAAGRLASGFYLTSESAEKTADAILKAVD
jgi:hypothetical protein